MTKWRALARVLIAVAVVLVVTNVYMALATTWVVWVPVQTSAGKAATFGNYWGGASFMYSTQAVTWILPPMTTLGTATYDQIQNYLGTSGAALWVTFSSQSTSSNYVYQGTVSGKYTVSIGSGIGLTSAAPSAAAFVVIYVPTKMCGQLYLHADIALNGGATTVYYFYGVYMFGNSTFFYITFYSTSNYGGSWVSPSIAGPNTCLSPGYYFFVATVYASNGILDIGTAQVSIGTTSEGTSTVPGTQYALNIAPASGDSMVFPWITSASPYVKLILSQAVVNPAGSTAPGSFNVVVSGTTYSLSNIGNILYFSDSVTNTFPIGGQITPTNCPTNVYELPTTVSTSVPKILSCQSISSSSSGILAFYPGDYAKYTSTPIIKYDIASYTYTVSYTDSAGNTYSVSGTPSSNVYLYVYITGATVIASPLISGTLYFKGVYPSNTGSLGYQSINVNAILTCNGTHITYTSVGSVSINCYAPYVYVNGLPNGWAPDVWDSKVGAWSYGYNYTISSNGTYYLVVATELVQLANPPVPQLPYEAIVVEMTKGALVTSLPTLYLLTNSTGVYSPIFGGCCAYQPGVLVASPYYYATSSGSASGPSVGSANALPYGIAYWVVATDTNSIPFILGFNGAFSEDLMFPGLVNGVYFYAPSPTSYGSAYLPANSSKIINAPVTFQVSFYVSSSSASGVLLAEENNYYPNAPNYYVPIIWFNNGVVYAYLGGTCGTATQITTVSVGNTYTITLYWNPANNTGEAYINGVEVAKSTSPVSCNAGQSMSYIAVGGGYTGNGWFPLSGVQIYYVAIWYNQLSTTTPSGNPTFIYEPSLALNTNAMVFGASVSAFSLIPGQPVYLGTYNGINGYKMYAFNFEYPEASSSTSAVVVGPVVISTGLQPSVNPPPSIQFIWLGTNGPSGGFYYWFGSSGFDYVGGLNGFFKDGRAAIIGFKSNWQTGGTGWTIPGIVTDSFNVTAVDLYANSALLPSNTFAYYIPNVFTQPGQTYYLYIPQSGVGYIGLNYMTGNLVSRGFTRACQPTTTIPSLGTTTFQWYWLNGIAWIQQSGGGPGTWWWGFVNSGPNEGFLIINGSSILFTTLLSSLIVSSIAAWSGGSSVTVDLSVTQSGQPIWLAPIYLVFAYSGQYVYGLYANAIEVEPNYVSYSITLPTCLANNPVTVTAYSVPTQQITSLLLTLTNPLNVILGATTVTPYPVPTNVTVSTTGTPPTTSNTTSSSVPIIQIGATQQPVVLPWWGTTLQSFIQINLATPIGIIGVGLIFGLLAYYWRTNRSGLLALAGGGIALFIIGAALSSIPLVALGLFIAMVSIAAFYVKRG